MRHWFFRFEFEIATEKDSILKSFKNGEIIKNFIEHDRLFVSEWPRESDFPSDQLQCWCEF